MQNWKKKIMILGLSVSLGAGGLYGCGNTDTEETTEKTEGTSGESQETVDEAEGSSQVQTEKPETTQAEHPQFVADGIRKVVLVEDGQEISFEGCVLPANSSKDGQEHEIHSFEEYEQWCE